MNTRQTKKELPQEGALKRFLSSFWLLLSLLAIAGCDDQVSSSYTSPSVPPPQIAETTETDPATPAAAPARIVDKTFDDIKFDIEPDAPFDRALLTDEVEALFGQRIRIRGWILPTFQRSGIKQFILVRDNLECCFGPGAALFDCIVVDMVPGKSAEFSVRSVSVEGKFTLEELIGPEGNHLAIFHMAGEEVK
ncbi:MAG: DUF3299 domain-containing protein [Aeoliella sp.]